MKSLEITESLSLYERINKLQRTERKGIPRMT